MSEEIITIAGPDDNTIYGRKNSCGANKIVIHFHGLTHNATHYLEMLSGEYFPKHGYDHVRISFYDRGKNSRRLDEGSITTQIRDSIKTIEYYKKEYDSIYVTGHSLGGLTAYLMATKIDQVEAISLWDPSFDVTHFWSTGHFLTYLDEWKKYRMDYGNTFIISQDMVEELKHYDDAYCLSQMKNIRTAMQFIIPEESIFLASPHTCPENYSNNAGGSFDLVKMPQANHTFTYSGNAHAVFSHTLKWFNKNK